MGFLYPSPTPPPGGTNYIVSGNQVLDPSGNPIVLHGVNSAVSIEGFPFVFDGAAGTGEPDTGGGFNSHTWWSQSAGQYVFVDGAPRIQSLLDAGVTVIRANIVLHGDSPTPTPATIANQVATGINELTAAGFVVIACLHDLTDSNLTVGSAQANQLLADWQLLADENLFANPKVWVGVINEPYGNGSTADYIAFHQWAIPAIRAQGWESPMVVTLPKYGQGIDVLDSGALQPLQGLNVIMDHHAYGAYASSAVHMATMWGNAQANGWCLFIGEYGMPQPYGPGNQYWQGWMSTTPTGVSAVHGNVVNLGIGRAIWNASGDGGYWRVFSPGTDPTVPFWDVPPGSRSPAFDGWYNL